MPPSSKKQAAFMRGVASGDIKESGLSQGEAEEYVSGYSLVTSHTRAASQASVCEWHKPFYPSGV